MDRAPGVDLGVWSEIRFSVLAEKMAYLKPYRAPYSLATAAGPAIAAEFRGLVPGDADPTHQLVLCLRPLVGAVSLSITSSIADFERHQALYLWLLQTQLRLHAGPAPAPDATHPQAQHDAGMKLARQGNPQEAMAWFRRAAEQGHARAQFDLARGYRLGEGVAQDMRQSFAWLHKAAQQGLALAQYNLAIMYGVGSGTAQDPAQAFHWLHKAAEQGEADAQYKVALSYIQGSGVAKSLAQAGPWALKAAQQGHADAQFYAGMMHESGGGLPEDMPRAIEWYRKAAAQRHGQAAERLKALGV